MSRLSTGRVHTVKSHLGRLLAAFAVALSTLSSRVAAQALVPLGDRDASTVVGLAVTEAVRQARRNLGGPAAGARLAVDTTHLVLRSINDRRQVGRFRLDSLTIGESVRGRSPREVFSCPAPEDPAHHISPRCSMRGAEPFVQVGPVTASSSDSVRVWIAIIIPGAGGDDRARQRFVGEYLVTRQNGRWAKAVLSRLSAS